MMQGDVFVFFLQPLQRQGGNLDGGVGIAWDREEITMIKHITSFVMI